MSAFSVLSTPSAYAMEKNRIESELESVLDKVLEERELNGEVSKESMNELEGLLGTLKSTSVTTRGYGQWHDMGKGWRARVDRPTSGAGQAKPHVHVEKGSVKGVESVDGTPSHGKTLGQAGVPNDIQKKVRQLNDYKKGKKDLDNMKKAKSQIRAKGLNLKKASDIIIAIGIFVAVVGIVIFATSAVSAWGAFLILI